MSRASTAPNTMPSLARRASRTAEVAFTTMIAWAFGLATAGVLLYAANGLWNGQFKVATPLTAADPAMVGGAGSAQPWGLTFAGPSGALTAALMGAGVMVSLGLSMMFSGNWRRLGLLLMLAWSALWAADGAMVVAKTWNGAGFSATMPVFAGAAALVLVMGCMVHRMVLLWKLRVVAV